MAPKIYLAGPDVFLPNAREVAEWKREKCREYGFEGLFPLDQDESVKADAEAIFRKNRALMESADLGFMNLTPFRGPSADAGTVFELGFMFALGKEVHGYAATTAMYPERVDAACGPLSPRPEGKLDRDGHLVEGFGLFDNLMIACAIRDAGGLLTLRDEDGTDALAAREAFEACLCDVIRRTRPR